MPSDIIACARIVDVVVPSPASSPVLDATSFTNWAPRFWNGSSKEISLATDTPSFVILGDPNPVEIATFLPLGPNVTFTELARILTPFNSSLLPSDENLISFAIV